MDIVRSGALAAVALVACVAAHAHGGSTHVDAVPAKAAPPEAPALQLELDVPSLAAHFTVRMKAIHQDVPLRQDWYLFREPTRIVLVKGALEDHWLRDGAGRIRLERLLHRQRTVIEYSSGELATLAIEPDWAALARLIDPTELARLSVVRTRGNAETQRIELTGRSAGDTLQVHWSPALQLPLRIERRGADGAVMSLELVQHAPVPQAGWPRPADLREDYARIDAADFGDMPNDPAVRLAEAIDVRAGWRRSHGQH